MGYIDPDKQREYQRLYVSKRRAAWLLGKACVKCGRTDRLEIDHIDPSKKTSKVIWSCSAKRLNKELSQCQVLCFWCHKIKTFEQRKIKAKHGGKTMYSTHGCRCDLCRDFIRKTKCQF